MTTKINSVLKEVLEKVKPQEKELAVIRNLLEDFLKKFQKKIKDLKIDAEIFVGGSFAKNTMINKDKYDADIFVRFDKKYKNDGISNITLKILKSMKLKKILIICGSRNYFQIDISSCFFLEIIPVVKIKNPKKAENITDLSYLHVKYIGRKLKSKKILDEVRLAKAFCYSNNCYGAESYIKGFSGYGLELLVYHYGNFLKFIKAIVKVKTQIVIDIEKHFKNKQRVLMDLNSSKLTSPIILIDPTYKQRNALAGLSKETFKKFQKVCTEFIKNPNVKAFEIKKINLKKIKETARKKKNEFILIEASTNKQAGNIAGSKLLKFYKHLSQEIERFFKIKSDGFSYNKKKSARYFFVVKKKKEILFKGPSVKDWKNVKRFKKKHKNIFVKLGRVYSKEKINFKIQEFIKNWAKKNKKRVKEMGINELRIIGIN